MKYSGLVLFFWAVLLPVCAGSSNNVQTVRVVDRPDTHVLNSNYVSNRSPLLPLHLIKLPVGSIQPEGWVRKYLDLQRDGLTGHLNEISAWLDKKNNAWLSKGGDHGWEEVPYWLKGYGDLAYILGDPIMIAEAKVWLEGVFASQQPDGYFGPVNERNGKRELWAQMIMLWCLQSYYEYSHDQRVIDLMTNYFKWQIGVPDSTFLKDYWENSRGGDNLLSVYWLYNRTGDQILLDLAKKIHRNTADWTQPCSLPNWHNVNIAQGFREPVTYYMFTGDSTLLRASYHVHNLVRRIFGQVPGGMFGADEVARLGYIDPRQGIETCGIVEQMASDEIMLCMTGDPFWAEHCENVAFNTYPAAVMPDFKALRYITCPNQTVSDSENHYPGIYNKGPFLSMNPFSSRCCQHNHAQGWPYFSEHLVFASPDNGVAVAIYGACKANVKVGDGKQVVIHEQTQYPFDDCISFTVKCDKPVRFPFYFRIPSWTSGAKLSINKKNLQVNLIGGKYVCVTREWKEGDEVRLMLPMSLSFHTWQINKNSISVNYGPLTFSLKIDERYVQRDSRKTAIGDSKWQDGADSSKWPTTEIYPDSPWNYALVLSKEVPAANFRVIHKKWPLDNFPFTIDKAPIEIEALGRKVPSWKNDSTGLCGVLPDSDEPKGKIEKIILIPMGAARLRISAFPASWK